jgi:hypothetical protein
MTSTYSVYAIDRVIGLLRAWPSPSKAERTPKVALWYSQAMAKLGCRVLLGAFWKVDLNVKSFRGLQDGECDVLQDKDLGEAAIFSHP